VVDVLLRLGIYKVFGQTHVNNVTHCRIVSKTHQKVVWLDVSVDKVPVVHLFEPFDQLVSKHDRGLQAEPPTTKLK
jgi:hypothetical protein